MNLEIVCGQTPILDLAAGVREHLAAKGYKERNLIRLQKIWNHFARYADNCHFTIEIGAAFLRDTYGIEWSEFPPPMERHQRRSLSAIRYLRDYELTGEISIHRPMKQPYVWPEQFSSVARSFLAHMDQSGYSKDYKRGTTREVHKFLEYLSCRGIQNCTGITISDIMDFIREKYSHLAISTLKVTIGKIRTFPVGHGSHGDGRDARDEINFNHPAINDDEDADGHSPHAVARVHIHAVREQDMQLAVLHFHTGVHDGASALKILHLYRQGGGLAVLVRPANGDPALRVGIAGRGRHSELAVRAGLAGGEVIVLVGHDNADALHGGLILFELDGNSGLGGVVDQPAIRQEDRERTVLMERDSGVVGSVAGLGIRNRHKIIAHNSLAVVCPLCTLGLLCFIRLSSAGLPPTGPTDGR